MRQQAGAGGWGVDGSVRRKTPPGSEPKQPQLTHLTTVSARGNSCSRGSNSCMHVCTYQGHTKCSQRAERPSEVQSEDVVLLGTAELHDELPSTVVEHEVLDGLLLDAILVELQHEVSRLTAKHETGTS